MLVGSISNAKDQGFIGNVDKRKENLDDTITYDTHVPSGTGNSLPRCMG